MRKNLVKYLIENDLKVGIMIDESTTISKKEALVICLLCRLPESTDTSRFFFDLTESDNTRAAFVVEMFLSNLHSNGFEDEFFSKLNFIWLRWNFHCAWKTCWRYAASCRNAP
jgi:hypothetical protein